MNMLNNASDYISGHVNKDKANTLAAESSEVTIEDNWKGDIKAEAFEGLKNPVSINTNDITGIEDRAFKDCKRLETLIMPNIERVGENVFEGCFSLHKVDVKDEDMARIVIEKIKACNLIQRIDIYIAGEFKISIKNNCEYLFHDKVPELIEGEELSVPHYDFTGMKENVIAPGAFKNIDYIRKVYADTTTIIEDNAFENCWKMHEIHLSSVREIGNEVFKECMLLENVHVSNGMEERTKKVLLESNLQQQVNIYVNGAFVDRLHDNLSMKIFKQATSKHEDWVEDRNMIIPSYYTKIDNSAIRNIHIISINTNNVTTLGDDVCRDCLSLESVCIPNVQEIGANFCYDCPNLRRITVKDETMANKIKKMFNLYNENRSVEISIYVEGQSDPFLKIEIEKDDRVVSREDAVLIMRKVLGDYLNIDGDYRKWTLDHLVPTYYMGPSFGELMEMCDSYINMTYMISTISLAIESVGKSLPESEIESMINKAMSEIDN